MNNNASLKLGQYLVQQGLVQLRHINRCLKVQRTLRERGDKKLLGEILLNEKLISRDMLRKALAQSGLLKVRCLRCGWTGRLDAYEPGKEYHCGQCRALAMVQDGLQDLPPPAAGGNKAAGGKRASAPRLSDTTLTSDPGKDPFINRIIGGCQILERIAKGGMGVVYKAKQLNLGRTVALKILSEDLSSDATFVKRFVNEARSAAELNHGNLIHINDVGEVNGVYYFSMEYVEGMTLSAYLKERKIIGMVQVAEIAYQVSQALRHAHSKNVIHRDIKPDNIMITTDGVVKLADLGLAKRKRQGESDITQAGTIMGTPYYMAPEQAKDFSKVDERSDIYSLGVTVYRMLTGRVPFEGKSPLEVMLNASKEQAVPVRSLRPEVPEAFEAAVARMMAKDPEDRYQNITEVMEAMGGIIQLLKQHLEKA